MHEDKLTHDERLRLECLAQANASAMSGRPQSFRDVIERAKAYEAFVRGPAYTVIDTKE